MKTDKVAVFLTNYNMPEATDALYEHVERRTCIPHDWFVTDNASDLVPPSVYTNVWIRERNRQTTAGWLEGLKAARKQGGYLAYLFCITSCDFDGQTADPLEPMYELLQQDSNAVGVHAALTADSTTSWEHLKTRGGLPERSSDERIDNIQIYGDTYARRTWMLDNLWCMYRADWFDSIGGFDPDLRYAWGIDLETCWRARAEGRSLWVHEGVQIRKVTNIGYRMERMRMSADERSQKAGENMRIILEQKYGKDYWRIMTEDHVEDAWR